MNYAYQESWSEHLPDGLAFCHWGGRELSARLVGYLKQFSGRVLDVCCGYGGTLSMLSGEVHGIDIDPRAVQHAQQFGNVIVGDALHTPYSNNYFDVVFAQDPDIILGSRSLEFFTEMRRITKRIIVHTYATQGNVSVFEEQLKTLGYAMTKPAHVMDIIAHAHAAGFRNIKVSSLHREYYASTKKMFARAKGDYRQLFEIELKLFERAKLTGIELIAEA